MGTAANPQNVQQNPNQQSTTVASPISNEAYNVITALQSKLEGLEAYRKYSKDQGGELWNKLAQFELQAVDQLCAELERMVKDGKLRPQTH
jgi:hypothetical protein